MRKKLSTQTNRLDLFDILLISASSVFFVAFFIYGLANGEWNKWQTYVAFFANIINIVNLVLTIKRRISNLYFGLAATILLGAIAFDRHLLGTIIRYWGVSVVIHIATLISWFKASKDKKSIEIINGNWIIFWITLGISLVFTALFTWMETTSWYNDVFNNGQSQPWYKCLFDALPFIMLIASTIMLILRYKQYWYFVFICTAGIGLWIYYLAIDPTDSNNWQMFLNNVLNILFAVKGCIEWSRNAKKNSKTNVKIVRNKA